MTDIADIREMSIQNHTELMHRIMHLNRRKAEQEEALKRDLYELYYSLQPSAMLKNTLHSLSEDPEIDQDITKVSVKAGLNFLIGKLLGKSSSIKGYFTSLLVERLADAAVDKYEDQIGAYFGKLKSFLKHS